MKKGKYVEIWENLRAENQKLLVFMAGLIIVVFLLLMAVINLAIHRTINITIPSTPPSVVQVPSKEFALWWARYYVNLLGNYTSSMVNEKYSLVMLTASPEAVIKLQKEINKIVDNKISQTFIPIEGSWKFEKGRVIMVDGLLKRWIGNDLVENKRKRMSLRLRWQDGKYVLEDWWYEN